MESDTSFHTRLWILSLPAVSTLQEGSLLLGQAPFLHQDADGPRVDPSLLGEGALWGFRLKKQQ